MNSVLPDFACLDAWLDELTDSRRRRILAARPYCPNDVLKKLCEAESEHDSKYEMIFVGGNIEFAVENKTGIIFQVAKDVVNRKVQYGRLIGWDEINWEPFYPYRKELYEWERKDSQE